MQAANKYDMGFSLDVADLFTRRFASFPQQVLV
jgi:hypothetical protein